MHCGKVSIVGAGPGDPGLLTLRGLNCLREAEVVLYDYLASDQLLDHAPADAELVCLGRHGHGRLMKPEEIVSRMIEAAAAGKRVVRLKGGDTSVFARLAEELEALEAAEIEYEIVPGITAALAAGSYAGMALTDRESASCVAFVTGQERADKAAEAQLDYEALAHFPGTLVFYMGVTTVPVWSGELVRHGKPAATSVAIVRRCSMPEQQVTTGTLGELENLLADRQMRPPAIIIVGEAARAARAENWFTRRPLFGRTVLVTRAEHQSAPLAERLGELGARVLRQPVIAIGPPADWEPVDNAIGSLAGFDWLVFSSANGVNAFMGRMRALGVDARKLGGVRLAAIGPATAETLDAHGLVCDLVPETYRAEALAEALSGEAAAGKRFLLIRASRGRETLAKTLLRAGGEVDQVIAYDSRDVLERTEEVAEAFAAGSIDWMTVTSSAIARSAVAVFGESLHEVKLAAISPLTAEVLSELGYAPTATASTYTIEGVVAAICKDEAGTSGD